MGAEQRLNAGNDRVDDNAALSPHGSRPLLPPDGEDVRLGETGQAIPLRKVTSQIVDRHRIGQIFGTTENPATIAASKGMVAIFSFALYHAYTFALLSMMFLLLAQYVCSMNVTSSELQMPDWLKMVGIMIASNMWSGFVTLSVKLLLSLPVFLLLRLSIRETFYESLSEHERVRRIQNYGTFHDKDPAVPVGTTQGRRDRAAGFVHCLSLQFTKCSIFLVALVLLVVACQPHPVLYTIGFFCIWCLLVIYFKISFGFFCRIAYPFWLGLIIYTSVVIISLYVYQFPNLFGFWVLKISFRRVCRVGCYQIIIYLQVSIVLPE
uniref:Piezo TM1-24 domain-containing protein n=1 Tax=Angiostrongylus cantonensis TaxID=6313 RepID=A0A0K0DNG2_ANGCA